MVDANIVAKSLSDTWVEECDDRHYRINKQRCLITGATGEIRSALEQRMAAKGIDCRTASRRSFYDSIGDLWKLTDALSHDAVVGDRKHAKGFGNIRF